MYVSLQEYELGIRHFQGILYGSLGILSYKEGRTTEAQEALEIGEAILGEVGDLTELGNLLCGRAEMESEMGDKQAAAASLREAQAMAVQIGASSDSELGRRLAKVTRTVTLESAAR